MSAEQAAGVHRGDLPDRRHRQQHLPPLQGGDPQHHRTGRTGVQEVLEAEGERVQHAGQEPRALYTRPRIRQEGRPIMGL